jgi:hypothetical protein
MGVTAEGAGMSELVEVMLSVNGQNYALRLEPRCTLLDAIRGESPQDLLSGFVADSPLEESGFEPLVPLTP